MNTLQFVHVKLLAVDFLSLTIHNSSHSPSFTRKGKLVSRAETVGVVVSLERKDKYLTFLVDDGSGCICCILWLNHQPDHAPDLGVAAEIALREAATVELGKLVRVRGKITLYRGSLQLTVRDVLVEQDPNMEVLHWLDCIRLAKCCYDLPTPAIT
ncbi:CST complex subunit STN1-like [Zingiber officinale]|uniref:CST complex subunit STN1-like n=1 Tax=Zingiber officinale TaxID=94328 RepID=UPI001C4C0D97|nr:CST complex subunit STN1-like [Zingiber officinale]